MCDHILVPGREPEMKCVTRARERWERKTWHLGKINTRRRTPVHNPGPCACPHPPGERARHRKSLSVIWCMKTHCLVLELYATSDLPNTDAMWPLSCHPFLWLSRFYEFLLTPRLFFPFLQASLDSWLEPLNKLLDSPKMKLQKRSIAFSRSCSLVEN